MTKDVLVSVSGLQTAVNDMESYDEGPIEVVSAGTYFFKDGKHFIFFEEVADGLLKKKKAQIETEMQQQLNNLLISYKGCVARVELSDSIEHFNIKMYHI